MKDDVSNTWEIAMDVSFIEAFALWAKCTVMTILLSIIYYVLIVPDNYVKDLSDIGFDLPDRKGKSKRAVCREVLRQRQAGNVPPVFPNGWFSLLESCELPRGQVRLVCAMGENLAVFRGETGQAHVLDAYCPHVGANMAIQGRIRGDCLECPFHAWRFSGHDGSCVSIPYAEKVPEFAKVRRWESVEVNGFVFVWHHAEGEPPSWSPQPVHQISDSSWMYVGRNEFLISCHIQDVHENAADQAHLKVLHGPGMVFNSLGEHVWSQHWEAHAQEGEQHLATMDLHHKYLIFGKTSILSMHVRAHQTGPGYVELHVNTPLGLILILQTVTPLEPFLQKVVNRLYCPWILLPFAKFILFGETVMFARDVAVWNHKKFLDKPILVKEDKAVTRYRRWYSQFYTEHSRRKTKRESLEW